MYIYVFVCIHVCRIPETLFSKWAHDCHSNPMLHLCGWGLIVTIDSTLPTDLVMSVPFIASAIFAFITFYVYLFFYCFLPLTQPTSFWLLLTHHLNNSAITIVYYTTINKHFQSVLVFYTLSKYCIFTSPSASSFTSSFSVLNLVVFQLKEIVFFIPYSPQTQ